MTRTEKRVRREHVAFWRGLRTLAIVALLCAVWLLIAIYAPVPRWAICVC